MTLLFRESPCARTAEATVLSSGPEGVRLDRTLFYPAGGGQPGDSGTLTWEGGTLRIADTRKAGEAAPLSGDDVLHIPEDAAAPLPAPGTPVTLEIDWERRHRHMRMHTTLHLLCAVVPGSVTGGQVGADRSRLDFDVPSGSLDKAEIEGALNALIAADHPVTERIVDDAELDRRPDLVRTLSVQPPRGGGLLRLLLIGTDEAPVDLQPCGGTHVARTGEIGPVSVVKIENKGRQNRRIVVALKE
ncbi:alanyl-tRNA editing protein [Rhodospirillum centenum]|uniref:Alanine--tRNA ligase n=1 Tax=Rhodospirillum centenum (strain ATCC 51521 / SW) TaxID=414684 RepID=B6IMI7_RHOCS|nr:alanyl-tRNA editing protein [Rhodospirillum centenum]ACI98566.1 alanyl-tRNA synthetase AlaS [Rhodospirillum centenum SW]